MKKMLSTSFVYLLAALAAGVFFREFTKLSGFSGVTALGKIHGHLMTLGFLFFLIAVVLVQMEAGLQEDRRFNWFYILYNIALPFMRVMMLARGILEVKGTILNTGLNGMVAGLAGLSHILITVALILFMLAARPHVPEK